MAPVTIDQFKTALYTVLEFLFSGKLSEIYLPLLTSEIVAPIVSHEVNITEESVLTLGSIETSILISILMNYRYRCLFEVMKQLFPNCICISVPLLSDQYRNMDAFNMILPIIECEDNVNIRNIIVDSINMLTNYKLLS